MQSPLRLLLGVLFVPLVLSQSSCALLSQVFQKPRVTLSRVDLRGISFEGIAADFVMAVDNPNPLGLSLARLDYALTIDGSQAVAGQANQAFAVPARGTGQMTLPVSFKFLDLVKTLEALLTKDEVSYGLSTTLGFATPIGVIAIPLAHSGKFPVPKLPTVRFASVALGRIDLSGAEINVALDVGNPNKFALPIDDLSYRVTVGGARVVESRTGAQSLAPGGSARVPIGMRVDFLKMGMGMLSTVRSGSAVVAFDGTLGLGGFKRDIHLEQRLQ